MSCAVHCGERCCRSGSRWCYVSFMLVCIYAGDQMYWWCPHCVTDLASYRSCTAIARKGNRADIRNNGFSGLDVVGDLQAHVRQPGPCWLVQPHLWCPPIPVLPTLPPPKPSPCCVPATPQQSRMRKRCLTDTTLEDSNASMRSFH